MSQGGRAARGNDEAKVTPEIDGGRTFRSRGGGLTSQRTQVERWGDQGGAGAGAGLCTDTSQLA